MSRARQSRVKQVVAINAMDLSRRPLATFRLAGEQVTVEWHDVAYRREFEVIGIMTAAGRMVPGDGRRFFDALDIAYSRSSFMDVVEMEPPDSPRVAKKARAQRPRVGPGGK